MMKIQSSVHNGGSKTIYKTDYYTVIIDTIPYGYGKVRYYGWIISKSTNPVISAARVSPVSKLAAFRLAKQAIYTKMLMRI